MKANQFKCLSFAIFMIMLFAHLAQAFELQWYGQSAFKITTPGNKVILVDPFR